MRDEVFTCEICGRAYFSGQRQIFGDQELCSDCFQQETLLCSVCGERIWADENAGSDGTPLCQRCYERDYTNCIRCGALLRDDSAYYSRDDEDNEEPLCYDCYIRNARRRAIQDYSYKPEPIFYGHGNRYLGVELEIDGAGEYSGNAKTILALANAKEDLIYSSTTAPWTKALKLLRTP